MDELELAKHRIRSRRCKERREETVKNSKYVDGLIARTLISVIIFFASVIAINTTKIGSSFIMDHVLGDSLPFTAIANLYNKYFGAIIPLEEDVLGDYTVFNETLEYSSVVNYLDGYELTVKKNYLTPILSSGVVVFVGEKENLGNTVIIQGIDNIDYWYSNVENLSVSIYDYVSKGEYLGTASGEKLYLTFKREGEFLDIDEVIG